MTSASAAVAEETVEIVRTPLALEPRGPRTAVAATARRQVVVLSAIVLAQAAWLGLIGYGVYYVAT